MISRRSLVSLLAVLLLAAGPAATALAAPGTRTIYLVRHGIYDITDTRPDSVGMGLVPLGVAQARLVGDRLRSLPVPMTSLWSSRLTRARETAQVIDQDFPDLKLQSTPLLNECTPPTWREDIMVKTDPAEAQECADQLEKAFATFFVPSPDGDANDVLVCHGNVIRYFVTKVLKVDTMAWLQMGLCNGSITTVQVRPNGSMHLLSFGDVGHIPPNMQTGLDGNLKPLVVPAPTGP